MGRALTESVIDLADTWLDVRRLVVVVFVDHDRAIGLDESSGFQREGVVRELGFRRGMYVEAVVVGHRRP
ncbi:hypothetical protein [Nocardioides euryhalodurans]|uniref:hypothetical protein n=1 Tax=Nocardioides euryhalodurans TaxID=2518370 RepID=UPI001423FC62|nr:hypothetical protein [Nocardioides euryhalodurans]